MKTIGDKVKLAIRMKRAMGLPCEVSIYFAGNAWFVKAGEIRTNAQELEEAVERALQATYREYVKLATYTARNAHAQANLMDRKGRRVEVWEIESTLRNIEAEMTR